MKKEITKGYFWGSAQNSKKYQAGHDSLTLRATGSMGLA